MLLPPLHGFCTIFVFNLFRSLTVSQGRREVLEFLRTLLIEIQPLNLNSLLLLYVNNSIAPSQAALCLLSEYLVRCSLPQYVTTSPTARLYALTEDPSKSCPRQALIKWLVNSVMEQCVPSIEIHLATLLSSLIVNRSHLFVQTEFLLENSFAITQQFQLRHDEFEKAILKSCFITPPTEKKVCIRNTNKVEDRGLFTVIPSAANNLLECLQQDFQRLPPIHFKNDDFMKTLTQSQYSVNILINIYNLIEKHKLGEGNNHEFKLHVLELHEKAFHRYINIISEFLSQPTELSADKALSLVQIMRLLLPSDHLCDKVKQDVSKQYTQKIRDFWKITFRNGLPSKTPCAY